MAGHNSATQNELKESALHRARRVDNAGDLSTLSSVATLDQNIIYIGFVYIRAVLRNCRILQIAGIDELVLLYL